MIRAYLVVNLDRFSVPTAMIGKIRVDEAKNRLMILLMEASSCVLVKLHSCAQPDCLIALLYLLFTVFEHGTEDQHRENGEGDNNEMQAPVNGSNH